uniref:cyanate transporter n=1 Tax=Halomonas sp. TaxID=1486246 RepID=UPI002639D60F|nr:cyanate transporter [Halomonas sp.]
MSQQACRELRDDLQLPMVILVVFVAINLRPFLTSPGPIIELIRADTGLTYTGTALLTLIPTIVMGLGAFAAPALQAHVGTRRGILGALVILALGSLLRLIVPGADTLLFTALLCGIGVAFIQSTFPGVIKEHFPGRMAIITGIYSATIMGGGALGAQVTPLLVSHGHDWREALAWLALPAILATLFAYRTLGDQRNERPDTAIIQTLIRLPRAWLLMVAFGFVNAGYSSAVTWLAPFYQHQGLSVAHSANLVSIMAICQAFAAVGISYLASSSKDRRPFLCVTAALQIVGYLGLAWLPDVSPIAWSATCGIGLGGSFAISLVTALDHLPSPQQAGALTAIMQGGGFLIAALGPLALAMLLSWTGTYQAGWIMHLCLALISLMLYLRLDPSRYHLAMNP